MRSLLILLLLTAFSLSAANAADNSSNPQAREMLNNYAMCYSFYSLAHFFFGSRNDRQRIQFYGDRVELSQFYGRYIAQQNAIDISRFDNRALLERNTMLEEIGRDLNQIPVLGPRYEPRCAQLISEIPAEIVMQFQGGATSNADTPI